jgi:two-component system, chemotaxis family, sensor kinase Cph1
MNSLIYSLRSSLSSSILHYAVFAAIALTAFVVTSYVWNIKNLDSQVINLATEEARTNWNKDQAFRRWATRHGGLYVKPDERTPPNPYLEHLPHRDVETTDGVKLTLMNPAYMMSQMTKEFEAMYGVKGKITGQILLNPANEADPWELNALKQFDKGEKEISEQAIIDGQPYIRLMRPMVMKKGCVLCHGHLGFKVGDIRGGVSISIPLTPYFDAAQISKTSLFLTHGIVWLIGMLTIGMFSWRGQRHEIMRRQAEEAIKESEAKYRSIVSSVTDGIITIDEKGIIHSFNTAAEKQFSYKEEEVIGKNISLLLPEPYQSEHDGYLQNYLNTREAKIIGLLREVPGLRKDGSTFPLEISVNEISYNQKLMFVGVVRDITQRKKSINELESYSTELKLANEELERFTYTASHDLQEPLRKVITFGDRLKSSCSEKLEANEIEYISRMQMASFRMKNLIEDLLGYSQFNQKGICFEPINLNMIVQEVLDDLEIQIELTEGNIQIYSLPTIEADKIQMRQLFQNIISNGLKYKKPDTPPKIVIKSSPAESAFHAISIADNGIGFEEKYRDKIFQSFQRLHSDKNISGSGMGLFICQKIVTAHGGTITVKSELKKGATFTITLPEKQASV